MSEKSRLDRAKTVSEIVIAWVGLAGLTFGAVLGFVEYRANQDKARVTETLKFVERDSKPPISTIRLRLEDFWFSRAAEMKQILSRSDKPSADLDSEWRAFVINGLQENKLTRDARILLEFYEALSICVENSVCDKKTALDFFGKTVSSFYNLHRPYIDNLREMIAYPDYGQGVAAFSKGFRQHKSHQD